jgi:hypothetical protein
MKANRAYELIHRSGGRVQALLAGPARMDHLEVVEIDSGEVVLFWDLPPEAARRVLRQMRTDLAALEADEFITAWRQAQT